MALEGTFQDMSLLDLFQVFVMANKTGVLILRQDTLRGVIYVLEGQGRDALMVQQSDRTVVASGENAVLSMLRWDDAYFSFRHDMAVEHRPKSIVHDWQWLEQAAMDQSQQHLPSVNTSPSHAFAPQTSPISSAHSVSPTGTRPSLPSTGMPVLSPDAPLHLVPRSPSSARTIKFNVDEWRVLSWIAQGASVRQIATTTGSDLEYIFRVVNDLYMDGLVTMMPVVQPSISVAAPAKPIAPSRTTLTTAVVPERRIVETVMRRIRGV